MAQTHFNIFNLVTPSYSIIFTTINHNKILQMKKFLLLATAALMVTGVALADNGKKKKKCAKGKTCCTKGATAKKSCCKDKHSDATTAEVKM